MVYKYERCSEDLQHKCLRQHLDLSMQHERKGSGWTSCAPCRGKKTCEQAECAGSAVSSGARVSALHLWAREVLVTISMRQGVHKNLVLFLTYNILPYW